MTEPIFDTSTERLYERGLPQHNRTADIEQDWTLKRWLSGIGGQQYLVDALIERFAYTPPEDGELDDTSDLVDPLTADAAWLPWLAQLVGVRLDNTLTVPERRLQIAEVDLFRGTKPHMAKVAQTVLSGDKHVTILDHTISSAAIGAAGQWDMLIITVTTETLSDPIQAIIDGNAKPAGVDLNHETFTSTWDDWEGYGTSWAIWDASSWTTMEESGL